MITQRLLVFWFAVGLLCGFVAGTAMGRDLFEVVMRWWMGGGFPF